jgi:hypothetical protein
MRKTQQPLFIVLESAEHSLLETNDSAKAAPVLLSNGWLLRRLVVGKRMLITAASRA